MKDERGREILHQVGQQQLHHEHSVTKQSCGLLPSKSLMPIASLECEYLLPSHHLPNPIQFNSIQWFKPTKTPKIHTHTQGGKKKEPHPQTLTLVSRRSHKMFTTHSTTTSCQTLFIAKRINHTHRKTQKETVSHTERKRESHTQRRIRETERERWGGSLPRDDDELLREERTNLVAMAMAAAAAPANAISFCFMAALLLLLLLFLLLLSW
jgi:hypothetical protein